MRVFRARTERRTDPESDSFTAMRQKLIAIFDIGDKTIECLGRASAAVEFAAHK